MNRTSSNIFAKNITKNIKETNKTVLLIRVAQPRNFPNLNQIKQQLELACARQGYEIVEIFYWYIDDPIKRDKIIATIEKFTHKVILLTNELKERNKPILDLNKFAEFKQRKIAKIYVVDAEDRICQRLEDL